MLGELGLHKVTVEKVAVRAGVNKVTIYRRWETREKLIAEALNARFAQDIRIPDIGNLCDDLKALARQVRDVLQAPETATLMAAFVSGSHFDEITSVKKLYWQRRLTATRGIVERAVQRGEVRRLPNSDELIIRIVGPIWFMIFGPGIPVDDDFIESVVRTNLDKLTSEGNP